MRQPKTDVRFDPQTFARLKRTMQQMSEGRRRVHDDPGLCEPLAPGDRPATDQPLQPALPALLPVERDGLAPTIGARRSATRTWISTSSPRSCSKRPAARPNLYLWGGEPLSYGAWEPLTRLLEGKPFWTVLCTNGIDLDRRMESILRISAQLAVLVSIDGLEEENDALRGAGSTRRTVGNVDQLLRLKQEGLYRGEVSVHCVIHELAHPPAV